jgi:hypothetical protein
MASRRIAAVADNKTMIMTRDRADAHRVFS